MGLRAVWTFRLLYAVLVLTYLFFALLPFDEGIVPAPDLVLCMTFAWVMRRPDYIPVWLLVPLLLLADALLMRPLGLWTLVVFLMSEYLRRRVDHTEAETFGSEVVLVASCIVVVFVGNHIALVLLAAETAPLLGQVLHVFVTIVFYPITAILSQLIGVRRLAPGELDTLGTRA
ncbi:MAG: rod shape-determining protein MreD [Jannaschia sp.]